MSALITARHLRLTSAALIFLLIIAGSCSRTVDPEGFVWIEPVEDPTGLPYELNRAVQIPIIDNQQASVRGQLVLYHPTPSQPTAMCVIADLWNTDDSLSGMVFYGDLARHSTISHINIRTRRIDDAITVDYDEDGLTDLAVIYCRNDSLYLHFLNEHNQRIARYLLLTGQDRNNSGHWDGEGKHMGLYDLNQDGRRRELLIAVDVGYDLYPRQLLCFDLDADSVIWRFPYAGAMIHTNFYVRKLGNENEPRVIFGLGSKGNAARTEIMDDAHAYLVVLDNRGRLQWKREVGSVFHQALPVLFDYRGDGSTNILVPHRYERETAKSGHTAVLEVLDGSGRLIDSLIVSDSAYVNFAMAKDLFGDRRQEVAISMSDGRVKILNDNLQILRKARFYTSARLLDVGDYLSATGLELLVRTEDKSLWMLNRNLWPEAFLALNRKFIVPDLGGPVADYNGLPAFFLSVDGNRGFHLYTGSRTPWTRIFTRHPSLAFWLAFVPMALVVLVIILLWRRTRRQYRVIARQKEHLDSALKDLREARKELVEAEEFRKTREALLASEQRFRELADLLPQTIFECDREGRLTYTNRAGLEATGYSLDDIAEGLYIHDVIEPMDDRSVEQILQDRISGNAPDSTEYWIVRKDGHRYPAMAYAATIYRGGEPVGIRGISIDMTETRRAQKALIESEERYRNLVESAGDPIFTVDRNGTFLFMNTNAAAQLGGKAEDFIGRTMHDVFPEEPARRQMESIRKVFDSETGGTFESVTVLGSREVHFRTSLEPVRDAAGKVVAVLGIARDISNLVNMTQELKAERDFIHNLLATANSAIVCFDADLRITEFNHECERLLGIDRENAIGRRWTELPYANECGDNREEFVSWIRDATGPRFEGILCTVDNVELTMLWTKSQVSALGHRGRNVTIAVGQDITDLKEAQEALATSEERYRSVWEASGQAISLTDEDGIIKFVNPAYCRLFQYTEDELLGHKFADRVMPEDRRGRMKSRYPEVYHNREMVKRGDYQLVDRFGNSVWAEVSVGHIDLEESGHLVVTMITDITYRRRAEQALRESEERFRTIAQATAVAIIITRPEDGQIYYANRSTCEMFEYSIEELLSMKSIALYANEEDRTVVIESLKAGKQIRNLEIRARRRSGEFFWGLMTVEPLTLDGAPGLMGSIVDISGRKAAEEALRESEERFRTIAEATPIPVAISRLSDGEIIYANPSLGPTFGYDADQMVGMKSTVLYQDQTDRKKIKEILRREGRVNNYELVGIRKDGSKFWALLTLQTIRFRGEMAVFGGFIDVTDRKEARIRLEQAAQEQYDQIKRVAGSLAHEIYNALFPASSLLDKLRNRMSLVDPEEMERNLQLLDLSEQAVHRAIDMTGLVKQYSRLETEKRYDPVVLHEVVQEVTQANAGEIEEHGIEFANEIPTDLEIRMYRVHAYSLLNNLATNAIKALKGMPKRKVVVSLLARSDDEIRISFRDTGPGIPQENRQSVFRAFYSTNPISGTGLGLAMVKRIVELYGGSVTLEDRVDNGADFVILLPFNNQNKMNNSERV